MTDQGLVHSPSAHTQPGSADLFGQPVARGGKMSAALFKVGDEVWWHVPTVMEHCRTWGPDLAKPVTVIAVQDRPSPNGVGHPQLVRVSPNYCPYGDEFAGDWFLPIGIKSHNDPAYRALKDTTAATSALDGDDRAAGMNPKDSK